MDSLELNCSNKLNNFIGDHRIKNLTELLLSKEKGVFVVVAWFDSVAEGVDMWFNDASIKSNPRFRMKVKVIDGEADAVFALFDEDVEIMAMETCPLMQSMGETCSLFPEEMDTMYGDAVLYKVEKDYVGQESEDDNVPTFKVLSICQEIAVVNMFIDKHIPGFGNTISFSDITEIPDLNDFPAECDIHNKTGLLTTPVEYANVPEAPRCVKEIGKLEHGVVYRRLPKESNVVSSKVLTQDFLMFKHTYSKRKAEVAFIDDVEIKTDKHVKI